MSTNTFLHDLRAPQFDIYSPIDVKSALDETEAQALDRLRALKAIPKKQRTFENTVLGLTRCSEEFDNVVGMVSHLESVLGEPWREVDVLVTRRASNFGNKIRFDKNIYRALKNVKETIMNLDVQEQKLLDELIRDYELGGIHLDTAKQRRLKQIAKRLSVLSTKFAQNSVKAQDTCGILVKNKADLEGISEESIKEAQEQAAKKAHQGYWIAYSEPNYYEVMSRCKVAKTRRAMYKAVKTLGLKSNKKIANEIVALRNEKAAILGFKTYADYATVERMVEDGQTALNFLEQIKNHYIPKVADEMSSLETFAKRYEHNPKLKLRIWDIDSGLDWYYAQKHKEELFSIDEESLRDYFEINSVLHAMFDTFSKLYDITFKRAHAPVWHADVEVYDLYDDRGRHIARVWCDWFARTGKRGGAWMKAYYVAERSKDAPWQPHLGCVIANLKPTTVTKPSLLSIRGVETIWHEFGHFMHLALGETRLKEQSMMDIEWDFVETPSQIMENWVLESEVITKFAKHYATGKSLDLKLVAQIKAARNYRVGSETAFQLIYGLSDLHLHINPNLDPNEVSRNLKAELYGIKPIENDLSMMNFTHIFAGGYAAGYYSYKWAEAIEADFYEHIAEKGVLSKAAGKEYQTKVLAVGSEKKAKEIVRDYLGRDSTIKALLRRDGITS